MKTIARSCLFLILTALAGALAALGGCTLGTDQTPAPPEEPAARAIPPAGANTSLVNAAAKARLDAIVQSNNAFAVALYEGLKKEPGNLFFSPYCISTALGMTLLGARGQTAEQLARVLALEGIEDPQADASALRSLVNNVWQDENILSNANGLWGLKDYPYSKDCLALMRQFYGGQVRPADFTAPASAAREINAWAALQTGNQFTEPVRPGDVSAATRLALVNTVYFKGHWENKFAARETRPAAFYTDARTSVSVPMMFVMETFGLYGNDQVGVLELPFRGRNLVLDVIMPLDVDGLKTLALGGGQLQGWLAGLRPMVVAVHLPKFEMKTHYTLNGTLAALGMPNAFDAAAADFSGMSAGRKKDLSLGLALHQAWMRVDEQGAAEAGTTAAALKEQPGVEGRPVLFIADRPFLFLIRDRISGVILFLGRVTAP